MATTTRKSSYGASPVKRARRRTKTQIVALKSAMHEIIAADQPMTVRQTFYQLVAKRLIDKTEAQYKTVVRLLSRMRLDSQLPFRWITDSTRWMRKPNSHARLADCLEATRDFYRRDLWLDQDCYVEVWVEKESLAGVLYQVTSTFDVPLMACKGYPSLSFLHGAAQTIKEQGKPCFIYLFGDYDPSGEDITRNIEARIREFAPGADLTFERAALNQDQIDEWDLPTRPIKAGDSRARTFKGTGCVDLDALPSPVLRALATECIEKHIDDDALQATKLIENAERDTLDEVIMSFRRELE